MRCSPGFVAALDLVGADPVVVHTVLMVASAALSGVTMFWLVRVLTASTGAGFVAGAVFACPAALGALQSSRTASHDVDATRAPLAASDHHLRPPARRLGSGLAVALQALCRSTTACFSRCTCVSSSRHRVDLAGSCSKGARPASVWSLPDGPARCACDASVFQEPGNPWTAVAQRRRAIQRATSRLSGCESEKSSVSECATKSGPPGAVPWSHTDRPGGAGLGVESGSDRVCGRACGCCQCLNRGSRIDLSGAGDGCCRSEASAPRTGLPCSSH
jgi:hypothetical protein